MKQRSVWRLGVVVRITAGLLIVAIVATGLGGYVVYGHPRVDQIAAVDAIIVLGGVHDGREAYGMKLARDGIADTVVLSNPYPVTDVQMSQACATKERDFVVLCVRPDPSSTRGEARFTRDLAYRFGWSRIMVITWTYHIPRARYILLRCFDGEILMRPVPREYKFSLAQWVYAYIYQTIGFARAVGQKGC